MSTQITTNVPASDDVTTSDKAAIGAARKAYDALTSAQKAKVPADTLKKLEAAEGALAAAPGSKTVGAFFCSATGSILFWRAARFER